MCTPTCLTRFRGRNSPAGHFSVHFAFEGHSCFQRPRCLQDRQGPCGLQCGLLAVASGWKGNTEFLIFLRCGSSGDFAGPEDTGNTSKLERQRLPRAQGGQPAAWKAAMPEVGVSSNLFTSGFKLIKRTNLFNHIFIQKEVFFLKNSGERNFILR